MTENSQEKRHDAEKDRAALEQMGYDFDVDEKPVTDPSSDSDEFVVVTVRYNGQVVGTRSEMTTERALERAVALANRHHRDPLSAERKTAF